MMKLRLAGAVSACALLVAACGQRAEDTAETDVATAEAGDAATADAATATTASADWPKGTRIVEEGDKTYRVGADGTRVVIGDNEWRVVTEDGKRYRVNDAGTRVRIGDDGIDLDLDDVDIDLGTNKKGNLDLDVSTDGTDAKN